MHNISRRKLIVASLGATALAATGSAFAKSADGNKTFLKGNKMNSQRALIIVDMQYDFLPGGALAVQDSDVIIPFINSLYDKFDNIIVTQDWHPAGHISFASSHEGKKPLDVIETSYGPQVLWPDHCVQGSSGAEISKQVKTDKAQLVIRKGYNIELDSYSAFEEADHSTPTGLAGYLHERGISELYVVGVATDFCVGWTAMDAVKKGFSVSVIEDATKGIDLEGSLADAWDKMQAAGVKRVNSADIAAVVRA